jgi:hypothetical protein
MKYRFTIKSIEIEASCEEEANYIFEGIDKNALSYDVEEI